MKRTVLGIDTATEVVAIGVGQMQENRVHVIASDDTYSPRAALSESAPRVSALLEEAGLSFGDLDRVVVGLGPGSFTGVRIGVALAKGLASALGVPLYGVGTADAVAWRIAALASEDALVGVVGDAMRGEVYPALFHVGPLEVRRLDHDTVSKPDVAAKRWATLGKPVLLTGNGLAKYADIFRAEFNSSAWIAEEHLWLPSGASLLMAHSAHCDTGEIGDGDAAGVLPIYTRLSDAEENERNSASRRRAGGTGGGHPA